MNNDNLVKIVARPVQLDSGLVKVDVNVQNAPADLFGVSFHLDISGVKWQLDSYSEGSVFGGVNPMLLISAKGEAIIAGVSLKRNDEAVVEDGTLLSFYVQPVESGNLHFEFDRSVLSIFEDGRKDVSGVEWIGGSLEVEAEFVDEEVFMGDEAVEVHEGATSLVYGVNVSVEREVNGAHLTDIYLFLLIILAVFIGISACYYLYRLKKK